MKNLIYVTFLLLFTIFSCTEIKKEKQTTPIETEINSKSKPDSLYFNVLLGKYPTQVELFENEILASRLKNINRFDFDGLITNWNTETPITIEDQIIHASGCKSNNCPSSGYEFFIDLKNDNINIYHFRSNTLRVYTEKDWITLPKGFSNEIEIKKANAKIGSTSDDMESTYDITL